MDGWICCGDLVGYGPDPDACIERIRALKNLAVICGNHDLAVIDRLDLAWFNPYARTAVVWTQSHLTDSNRVYLETLTARLETLNFTLAHGTPRSPVEEYLLSPLQFRDNVSLVRKWPLFVGHSHLPLLFRFVEGDGEKIDARFLDDKEVALPRASSGSMAPVALNPGSVGQPRDQDPRAACGLYDSDRGTFRVFRVPYDIGAVQEKIRAAGLPEYLALRLAYGQ